MNLTYDGTENQIILQSELLSLITESNGIVGRGLALHGKADDRGQPTGNAGNVIAAGVIGIASINNHEFDVGSNAAAGNYEPNLRSAVASLFVAEQPFVPPPINALRRRLLAADVPVSPGSQPRFNQIAGVVRLQQEPVSGLLRVIGYISGLPAGAHALGISTSGDETLNAANSYWPGYNGAEDHPLPPNPNDMGRSWKHLRQCQRNGAIPIASQLGQSARCDRTIAGCVYEPRIRIGKSGEHALSGCDWSEWTACNLEQQLLSATNCSRSRYDPCDPCCISSSDSHRWCIAARSNGRDGSR